MRTISPENADRIRRQNSPPFTSAATYISGYFRYEISGLELKRGGDVDCVVERLVIAVDGWVDVIPDVAPRVNGAMIGDGPIPSLAAVSDTNAGEI